jgi:hypothetical protein
MTFVESESPPANVNLQNFVGVVNEVLNYGFNDGPQVNRGRVEAWVNEAQFQIARQIEAPEFQEQAKYETETGVYELALPDDFLRVQDFWYPQLGMRLRGVDLQQYNQSGNPKLITGVPTLYTLYKDLLLLYPAPQQGNEELVLHYIREPPALVSQTDVPVLNPNYWHLLIDYALTRAFEGEDDYEAAQQFQGRYQRDLAAYGTDVQSRSVDRPVILDGTWSSHQENLGRWGW